jgi:hypothetical protein
LTSANERCSLRLSKRPRSRCCPFVTTSARAMLHVRCT